MTILPCRGEELYPGQHWGFTTKTTVQRGGSPSGQCREKANEIAEYSDLKIRQKRIDSRRRVTR
jgi:hypothetical protein